MIKPLLYFGLAAAVLIWIAALICIFADDNNWEDEMDDIDRACEREQMDRDLAIAAAAQHEPMLPACGEGYNCGSSVFPGARFCDKDCADDHSARKSAEARRGAACA
jgi:hypothetical protein